MTPRDAKPQPTKSGRPAGFSRQAAIQSAMQLFWRKGYPAVTAKDLAESMAIQRSSFYNSFGSKEAVFGEVLEYYARQAPDAELDKIAAGKPVVPVLVELLRAVCRIRAEEEDARGCLVCNSLAELNGIDETNARWLKKGVERKTALVARLLRQAIAQQEIAGTIDPDTAARAFIAFLIGLNLLAKVVRDEQRLWTGCEHFLSGYGISGSLLASHTAPAH